MVQALARPQSYFIQEEGLNFDFVVILLGKKKCYLDYFLKTTMITTSHLYGSSKIVIRECGVIQSVLVLWYTVFLSYVLQTRWSEQSEPNPKLTEPEFLWVYVTHEFTYTFCILPR